MYKLLTFVLLISTLVVIKCQVYFPEDNTNTFVQPSGLIKNFTTIQSGSSSSLNDANVNDIIANGILQLTLSIDKINSDKSGINVAVYSPVGISGALALVLLGSNGKTFDELSSVMGLASGINIQSNSELVHANFGRLLKNLQKNSDLNVGAQVKFATAIFVQDDFPIRSIYKTISENIYNSEILNLDFRSNPAYAQNVINAWVTERTNSKITKILDEQPSADSRVIICSALYFLGQWEKPFFNGITRKRPFYPNGFKSSNPVMVDMMSNGGMFPYYKDTTLNCEILGLPYKGNKTTMYVVMPRNSNKEVLRNFEKQLTPNDLERLVKNTKYVQAVILFPKMTLESTIDLRESLQKLGANSLFNPVDANLGLLSPGYRVKSAAKNVASSLKETLTNVETNPIVYNRDSDPNEVLIFSRIGNPVNCTEAVNPSSNETHCSKIKRNKRQIGTLDSLRKSLNDGQNVDNPGLYADQVIHKVYMDITESGTEAAAATSVSLSRGGDITTFRVDVPFLFFIRDEESKIILFWGSVYNPPPSKH